jgi:hypothetical protein
VPRQNRRRRDDPPDGGVPGRAATRRENGPDGDWLVRAVTGAAATKAYRCPGCDQEVPPGVPHVVAWPDDGPYADTDGRGLADRRHWHTACWQARGRRSPRVQRGRDAPRY